MVIPNVGSIDRNKLARCLASSFISMAIGLIGWNGNLAGMIALPLVFILWNVARSRTEVFCMMLAYYMAADRGLFDGAAVYFMDPYLQNRSLPTGLFFWTVPSTILAGTWALLWGRENRPLRMSATLLVLILPPVGIIGWGNPLTAAGALFPAAELTGLVLTVWLSILLATIEPTAKIKWNFQTYVIGTLLGFSVFLNLVFQPVKPDPHIDAVSTHFDMARMDGDDQFDRMNDLLALAEASVLSASPHSLVIFPELVGGDWDVTGYFWQRIDQQARKQNVSVLVGAHRLATAGSKASFNSVFGVGNAAGIEVRGRMSMPYTLWNPFREDSVIADFKSSGTAQLEGKKTAFLVCYEHIIMWPVMLSMLDNPERLIGVANVWWAKNTSIPEIQQQILRSWGRLLNIPTAYAGNF